MLHHSYHKILLNKYEIEGQQITLVPIHLVDQINTSWTADPEAGGGRRAPRSRGGGRPGGTVPAGILKKIERIGSFDHRILSEVVPLGTFLKEIKTFTSGACGGKLGGNLADSLAGTTATG